MEKKGDSLKDFLGCGLTSLLGLLLFGGFCVLMFWICLKLTGSTI